MIEVPLTGSFTDTLSDGTEVTIQLQGSLFISILAPDVPLPPESSLTIAVSVPAAKTIAQAAAVAVMPPSPPSSNARALGAYIVLNGNYVESMPSIIDQYATKTGRAPAAVNFGSNVGDAWVNAQFDNVRSRGAMPVYTLAPTGNCADIIAGTHDSFFASFAQAAHDWGHPYYLRFAWEMNGNWWSWGYEGGHNGNTPALYARMWRHVHDIFTQHGATNTRWVFCVNNSPFDFTAYPGGAYVDYLAMDGYNYGTVSGHVWQSFDSVFSSTYHSLVSMDNTKPILITEIGCVEQGGNKSAWITDAFNRIITAYPAVTGVLWFNAPYSSYPVTVDTSAASLAAYRAVVANSAWQGTMT